MQYEEIKKELESIIDDIPMCRSESDFDNVAERFQRLYRENDVPKDLKRMFILSDCGLYFRRVTGRYITGYVDKEPVAPDSVPDIKEV